MCFFVDRKILEKKYFEENYAKSDGLIRREHASLSADVFVLKAELNKILGNYHPDIESLQLNSKPFSKPLISIGNSSLGILFEKKWLKERNLEKGDVLRGVAWR